MKTVHCLMLFNKADDKKCIGLKGQKGTVFMSCKHEVFLPETARRRSFAEGHLTLGNRQNVTKTSPPFLFRNNTL